MISRHYTSTPLTRQWEQILPNGLWYVNDWCFVRISGKKCKKRSRKMRSENAELTRAGKNVEWNFSQHNRHTNDESLCVSNQFSTWRGLWFMGTEPDFFLNSVQSQKHLTWVLHKLRELFGKFFSHILIHYGCFYFFASQLCVSCLRHSKYQLLIIIFHFDYQCTVWGECSTWVRQLIAIDRPYSVA